MTSMGIYEHHRHVPRYVVVWVVVIAAILGGAAALGALTVLAPAADATPPKHKVTICHNGHPITVADDGYWGGHIHHPGDTLGACPVEPTEEPTWTPSPEPSSSATTPAPTPSSSVPAEQTPTPEPSSPGPGDDVTPSPEPSATVTPQPSTPPSPSPTTLATGSPVPSVTSTLSPLPVLPESGASSVPYTAPDELAATGMSEATGAGIGLAAALLGIGTVLVLARRKESQR
jgi:hypothetical protein